MNPSQALESLNRHPYYSPAAVEALQSGEPMDDATRQRLRMAVALNAPLPDQYLRLVDPDGTTFGRFYPAEPEQSTPSTDSAIATFLATYGTPDPSETELLERLIFNPTPSYDAVLEARAADDPLATDDTAVSEQDRRLDAFLNGRGTPRTERAPEPDAPLAASLLVTYIRRGRYQRAMELLQQLNLTNPEKSVYFADQMRFLRKLIANEHNRKEIKKHQ